MADGATNGRVPPNDMDAEAAVLSACLLDRSKEALDEARSVLGAGRDFYADANRIVFEAMIQVDQAGKPVDEVTVLSALRSGGQLGKIGGAAYLAQLSTATPAVAHVRAHAELVALKASQRRMVTLCQTVVAEGYGELPDVRAWLLDAAQAASDLAVEGVTEDPAESMSEIMPRVFEALSVRSKNRTGLSGVDTGWRALNHLLGGWRRGKLHVVGGRPGMGKSSFVLGALINVARTGEPASMFSAEMTKEELVERSLGVEANVSVEAISKGALNAKEWAAVTAASERLRDMPLTLKYLPGARIAQVRAFFRAEQRKRGKLGIGAVDYMQVLDGERRANDSRESEVANISKRLMWMAGEFDFPLLGVSQLNRSVEARANQNKRPSLGDLRESGAIEQDAFTVTLLYRDEYYNKGSELAGVLEANVAKHRSGPTGTAKLAFVADSTLVANLAEDEQTSMYPEDR